MGATGSKPDKYSIDQFGKPIVYKGDYMQTYTQLNPGADGIAYGSNKLQFGAKIIQDIDSGPRQGDFYVSTPTGTRQYVTRGGKMLPNAANLVRLAKNYGNGPSIMISGSPLAPKYSMFYAKGGEKHGGSNAWTPVEVNSPKDIINAMTESDMGHFRTDGKYANYYGDASINPFSTEGRNVETDLFQMQSGLTKTIAAVAVPVLGIALDDVVPFGSTILNLTGANAAIQKGINSLAGLGPPSKDPVSAWDPNMSNMIKDPRLPGYLQTITDQSHQLISKYGSSDYTATQKMAQQTPQQMIQKAQQLADENKILFAKSKVQEITDLSAQLKKMLPPGKGDDIFSNIQTGLSIARTPEQQMNVIEHFSQQIKTQLLPLLTSTPDSLQQAGTSTVGPAPDLNPTTASAQVGHPVLSINGTDSRQHTEKIGQETMSSAPPTAHN